MTTTTVRSATDVTVLVHGLALTVLLGVDGPTPWLAVRALVVVALTAALLAARRRTGLRRGAWLLLGAGIAGTIAGGAIGVGHAVKDGASVEMVAGLLAMATGIGLVAIATTTLVRNARRWRKLLAVPIAAAILILVVAPMTLAVFVTNVPALQLGKATPSVMGMSMGAEQAIGAAGDDARIRAVIAEGSTARGARDEGDPGRGVSGWLVRYFDWTTAQAADLMTSAHRPTKLRDAIAAAAPRPVLIIAAGTLPPEVDAAHVFQSAAPDSVELWIAPDAGHTTAYDTYPEEWEARVIAFFDRTLR